MEKAAGPIHANNFDFLRLLFASFVLISHSHALSGSGTYDWMFRLSGGQSDLSYLGVRGFFVISGYLIFQSLRRSRSVKDYFWKRALRLYPGLAVVLALTVLLCSLPYEGDRLSYFTARGTWAYFLNNLSLVRLQYGIKGVFEGNPFRGVINGSLWTIPYEVAMYCVVSLLFRVRAGRASRIILGAATVILLGANVAMSVYFRSPAAGGFGHFANLGLYFISGSLLAAMDVSQGAFSRRMLGVGGAMAAGSLAAGGFGRVEFLAVPMVVIGLGLESTSRLTRTADVLGDLSYGFYIYGFPVQQALVHYLRPTAPELMASSFVVTFALSYLSWHLVESQALRLKTGIPSAWTGSRAWSLARVTRTLF